MHEKVQRSTEKEKEGQERVGTETRICPSLRIICVINGEIREWSLVAVVIKTAIKFHGRKNRVRACVRACAARACGILP